MNREDLIKKLELARVGNGTQTYNDVVVTLTKEETLELLKNNERLEKELKQTKLNFKNSQTHSKNCYKKLKEKYEKLERAYKNNEVMTRDLNELINRNLKLQDEYQKLKEIFKKRAELCSEFGEYNRQYEKVLDFLMDKFKLELKGNRLYFLYNNQYFELDKKEYKLLKEVFGYEQANTNNY